jgi:hypothetical protein
MIVEHRVTYENEREIGEKLGSEMVVLSLRSWRRLKAYAKKAQQLGIPGFDWELNVAVLDLRDELEEGESGYGDEGNDGEETVVDLCVVNT